MSSVRTALVGLAAGVCLAAPLAAAVAAEAWEGRLAGAGAWTLPDNNCSDIFVAQGGHWTFHKPVDMFGPSFIVEGREIRGPEARCRIIRATEQQDKINMVISCNNSVSFMQNVVELQVKNDHEIERHFPGSEELTITYKKCPR